MKTPKSRFTSLRLCLACQHRISCCTSTIAVSFRRCDWLFPPSVREVSPGNRSNYKSARERVDSKGFYGRWGLHLMGSWYISRHSISHSNWAFQKTFSHLFLSRHVLSKLFIGFAITWNLNLAVNLVTSFSRQKLLKSKNKNYGIFWNTNFYHPAKF